ncbi:MAG: MATE family efflux transporter [Alphaproteobacteria bacterium]|nr:MATE family efflux transporter [Alphaproteobacteria bacterium]
MSAGAGSARQDGAGRQAATQRALREGPILGTLGRLAAPNAFAMAAAAGVSIAETAYVGRLGVSALAGVTLAFPLVMLMQMMSAGAMGGGISSAVSRALGAGDIARVEALTLCAAVIGVVGGAAAFLVFTLLGPAMFSALGGRGAALAEAEAYARVAAFGVAAVWVSNSLASTLRGSGRMAAPAVVILCAAALQVAAGGAFAFGWGPAPALGVSGVALGQAVAFAAATLGLAALLRTPGGAARLRFDFSALRWDLFADILRVGAVGCLSPLLAVGSTLAVTAMVARFGPQALAGYGIGARLEFLLIPVAFAIGVASVPMVGVAIGAGDVARARRVAWTAGAAAFALLGAIGILAAAFPGAWAGLFTRDTAVIESATLYLRFAGLGFGFFGLGLCLYFASQGAGKILGPIAAQAGRFAVILIGGWALTALNAPTWTLYALIAASMAALGLGTAAALRLTPWGAGATVAPARA